MSTINLEVPLNSQTHQIIPEYPQSFYQSSFKGVRVISRTMHDTCAWLAYTIFTIVCRVFNLQAQAYFYNQKAEYYSCRAVSSANIIFPGKIINFSVNTHFQPTPLLSNGNNVEKAIEERYSKSNPAFYHAALEASRILKKKSFKEIESGICTGQCLYFASIFLRLIAQGKPWLASVENASGLFENGGPKEAEITQMFYGALFKSQYPDLTNTCSQLLEEPKPCNMSDILSAVISSGEWEAKRRAALLNRLRLRPMPEPVTKENVVQVLTSLPAGTYLVHKENDSDSKEASGHVMLYIKESEDRSYFFDPNFGTNMLTSSNNQTFMFNLKGGAKENSSLQLTECRLIES